MKAESQRRQSNFELLRVVSMFFIVIYHIIYHGNVIENCTNQGLSLIFTILELITIVHVNSFILVSGYFQSKSNFKQSKVWALINSSLFYKAAIIIIFSFLGYISLSKVAILKELFFLNLEQYWFIKVYLFLYCLSPFLNKFINSLDKKYYQKFLLVSFVIFSLIPYFTGNQAFSNDGYSLYNFVFLYFIGAYLRRFPINKSYLFKKCSKNLLRLTLIIVFFYCAFINYLIFTTSNSLIGTNSLVNEISNNLIDMTLAYSNPIIMLQSVAFFLLFETINIKSNFINNISKLTLGIYMIHDNNFVRGKLYEMTNISTAPINSYSFILYVIFIACLIFVSCAVIEWLRQFIFRLIYERKFSIKIREKYYKFIHSFRISSEVDS